MWLHPTYILKNNDYRSKNQKTQKVKKEKRETFDNPKMVLTKVSEEVVDPAFHSSIRVLATKGFGTTTLVDTLSNIQRLYGKLRYQDIDAALLSLNKPMNRMQPVEVMLRGNKEVKLFHLDNPDKDRTLT